MKLRLDFVSSEYLLDITILPLGNFAPGRTSAIILRLPVLTASLFSSSIRQLDSILQINLNDGEPVPFVLDGDSLFFNESVGRMTPLTVNLLEREGPHKESTYRRQTMISSDDIKNHQESLAIFAQGQDLEKSNKITGTPYLMSPHSGKENEKTTEIVEKPKTKTKRQMPHKRPLTKRESEIVRLISGGLRNKDVAKTLGISVKTVETHRVNIMNKLSLQNLAQLIRYAVQNGLIHIEVENK